MLKLRLKRFGKKREPSYRIVVAQSTSRRDGLPLAEVGFYNPRSNEVRLDVEAIQDWMKKGAQPTETVTSILVREKVMEANWQKRISKSFKPARGPMPEPESTPEAATA
jgi:small subunit ribosomal protein S16